MNVNAVFKKKKLKQEIHDQQSISICNKGRTGHRLPGLPHSPCPDPNIELSVGGKARVSTGTQLFLVCDNWPMDQGYQKDMTQGRKQLDQEENESLL